MHVSEMVAEDSAEDWHSYRSQNTTDTREDTFTWCRNDHTALFCKIIIVFYYLTLRISTWGGRELICIEHLDKKPDALQLSLYLLIMVLPHLQGRIKKLAHEQVTPSRYWNSFVSWLKRSSVQFSYSAVSDFLQSHGLQHSRLPCPSPTPGACSNSCPSSWWCHPTNSSFVFPFSCPQSFPASGSFPLSQFFTSGGQSIGVSASASVFPMNIQDWFPLGLTGWISLQSKGLSRVFSNTTVPKHQFFGAQLSL